MNSPNLEIERKFLVKSVPENLEQYPHELITQGYLALDLDNTEVRVRHKGKKFFFTVKKGNSPQRIEEEIEISQENFNRLWPIARSKHLQKMRYKIPFGKYTIELDFYLGFLKGLVTAEVEFETIVDYETFQKPDWFDEEVSTNSYYRNYYLASHGLSNFLPRSVERSRVNLKTGLETAKTIIENEIKIGNPLILLVAGGSASGKTSAVAQKLKEHFGDQAEIISMDNYYFGLAHMKNQRDQGIDLTWDHPEAFNFELLQKQLEA